MDEAQLRAEHARIVAEHGPWTCHRIRLADDVWTMDRDVVSSAHHQRVVQSIADILGREDLKGLRVLDLGCLEGGYTVELARQGAEVVGIDIRDVHLAKARFAKQALGLENLSFLQDDVRNLSVEEHGTFDVVFCCGIFYHLDAPDIFTFMESMHAVCKRLLILDTNISIASREQRTWKGKAFWGCRYREHADDASDEERERRLWQSIDNTYSFWLTENALFNLLGEVGFTSAYRVMNPACVAQPRDRVTLAAIRGTPIQLHTAPPHPAGERWPKRRRLQVSPFQLPGYGVWEACRDYLPEGFRSRLKRALRIMTPPVQPPE